MRDGDWWLMNTSLGLGPAGGLPASLIFVGVMIISFIMIIIIAAVFGVEGQ